jgi:hypothetical protein
MLQADRPKFIGSAHSCYIEEQEVAVVKSAAEGKPQEERPLIHK